MSVKTFTGAGCFKRLVRERNKAFTMVENSRVYQDKYLGNKARILIKDEKLVIDMS